MQLKSSLAFAKVVSMLPDGAFRRRFRSLPVMLEIDIVRVILAGRVRRVVYEVGVRGMLLVGRHVAGHGYTFPVFCACALASSKLYGPWTRLTFLWTFALSPLLG